MKKIKLSLDDISSLGKELSGVPDVRKGLLNHNLNLGLKYRLNLLLEQIKTDITFVEESRNSLIKELGEKVGDKIILKDKDEYGNFTPSFLEYVKRINEVLIEEKEIEIPSFSLEEISKIDSDENFEIFFKILKDGNS